MLINSVNGTLVTAKTLEAREAARIAKKKEAMKKKYPLITKFVFKNVKIKCNGFESNIEAKLFGFNIIYASFEEEEIPRFERIEIYKNNTTIQFVALWGGRLTKVEGESPYDVLALRKALLSARASH